MVFGKRSREDCYPSQEQQEDAGLEDVNVSNDEAEDIERVSITQLSQISFPEINAKLKPLMQEVIIHGTGHGKNPGGTKNWRCKHCNKTYSSSYTRIHHHFFGAPLGGKPGIGRCALLQNNREEYEKLRKRVIDAESSGVCPTLKNSTLTKRHKPEVGGHIEDAFKVIERDMVDLAIVKALCAGGVPFNFLRCPQFHEMASAINRGPKGYKPPSFEKARTTLLDECKRSVEKQLFPIKDTWHTHGVSIVSDGWTNVKQKPLINIIAVNSRGAMFLYADDFSEVEKTGLAIAEYILKAIEEIGSSNVVQVVTDNAANCKLAGKEIEKVHKHIFWSPCVVHTLNLVFKDMSNRGKFEWFRNTYQMGKNIVKYFVNQTKALAIFRAQSKLELLKVAKTRFASHYILLKRLVDYREALATTIVLKTWKDWVKSGDEHARTLGALVAQTISSEGFWGDVDDILAITKPIYLLIKFCDGDGPKMGEIYEKMDNMLGEIEDIMTGENGKYSDMYPDIHKIIVERWEKMSIPLHCLAFALTPRFYDSRYLNSRAPGGVPRKAPNQDYEVIKGVMQAFAKIGEDEGEQMLLREQFATFHGRKGLYAMPAIQIDVVTMDPIDWWSTYGSQTPELAEVAKKILARPVSSSSAERNWSTYGFIHNVKRNRLNSARADKLVFIHSNIRLQSRFSNNYKDGPYKKWDVNPEATYIDDSVIRLENMRWRQLDEEYSHISNINEEKNEEIETQDKTESSSARTQSSSVQSKQQTSLLGSQQARISNFSQVSNSKGKGKRVQ